MNDKERQLHEMLDRVNAFGSAHAKDFPAGTLGHEMFAMVGRCAREAVGRTTEHTSERRRGTAAAKARARKGLRDVLGAIRRTAYAIALDSPGFERRFQLPPGNGAPRLLAAARSLQDATRESTAEFVAHGMPPAFLDDLAARIDGFEQAMRESRESRFARRSAIAGLKASLAAGFRAIRRLDAEVPNVLQADSKAMTEWRRARHVARRTRPRQVVASTQPAQAALHPAQPLAQEPLERFCLHYTQPKSAVGASLSSPRLSVKAVDECVYRTSARDTF
jgi:hypothetical protein